MWSARKELARQAAEAKTDASIARQQIADHLVECAARYGSLKASIDAIMEMLKRVMFALVGGLVFMVYRYLQSKGTLP